MYTYVEERNGAVSNLGEQRTVENYIEQLTVPRVLKI